LEAALTPLAAPQLSSTTTCFKFQLRNFKKQIEEAEEIAAMNLAKFRKAQVSKLPNVLSLSLKIWYRIHNAPFSL
jgi:hypothetical protein